ncbi:hypothetical protein V6N13_065459 [Hibiscus sabdariffa]|uniref:Uncharacterized protein n=1 Tax=Hibiscus sabdariffa TaxID=183260 RepID=A0ABR2QQS7_9ROSI
MQRNKEREFIRQFGNFYFGNSCESHSTVARLNVRMLRNRAPSWGRLYCGAESYMLKHRTDPLLFVHNEWEAESSQVGINC